MATLLMSPVLYGISLHSVFWGAVRRIAWEFIWRPFLKYKPQFFIVVLINRFCRHGGVSISNTTIKKQVTVSLVDSGEGS